MKTVPFQRCLDRSPGFHGFSANCPAHHNRRVIREEVMRTLIDLFRVPSAKTLAQRQIESPSASGSSTSKHPSTTKP